MTARKSAADLVAGAVRHLRTMRQYRDRPIEDIEVLALRRILSQLEVRGSPEVVNGAPVSVPTEDVLRRAILRTQQAFRDGRLRLLESGEILDDRADDDDSPD